MKYLRDNRELYEYLLLLSVALKKYGADELSELVENASHQIVSAISTEFLGESRIALRQVLKDGNQILSEQERADLLDVLSQLGKALEGRFKKG